MVIVKLFQILLEYRKWYGSSSYCSHPGSVVILISWENYLGYVKEEGIQPKMHLVGEWLSVAFGTYAYHFHSFSVLLMGLSSWKELRNNSSADANNPNKLFYKYTTNSNTFVRLIALTYQIKKLRNRSCVPVRKVD